MSRGDQRERDRAKKQAKLAKQSGGSQRVRASRTRNRNLLAIIATILTLKFPSQEGRPADRNAEDKLKLEAKVAAKREKLSKEEQQQSNTKAPIVRKKKDVKNASLDDLLDAGLTKGKKK